MQRLRELATVLTGSYVYSDQLPFNSCDALSLDIVYDPDDDDSFLNVIIEISSDLPETPAASSQWLQVGAIVWTAGDGVFTARTLKVASSAAGTKKFAHWDVEGIKALKFRVGVKETATGTVDDFGNCEISAYPYKR